MGAILGASGGAVAPLAQSLGVSKALPSMGVPSSIMPLSQQIAGMTQPALSAPMLGGEQKTPSLGVDLSMLTGPQGPSIFEQLGSSISNAGKAYGDTRKLLQPQTQPMQMMQLSAPRQTGPLQSSDLLALLRNLGGY